MFRLVLGDMLELGRDAADWHRKIGAAAARGDRHRFLSGRAHFELQRYDSARAAFEDLVARGTAVPAAWHDEARVALGWLALPAVTQAVAGVMHCSKVRVEQLHTYLQVPRIHCSVITHSA